MSSADPIDRPRRGKTYSVPNLLTYGRVLAVPLVAACLFAQVIYEGGIWLRWVALGIFIVAAITDYFDGYLARAWSQHSAIGRMLDPIADKLLVGIVLMMLAADGTILGWSLWAAMVILAREILVSGLREFLAELRVSVPVTRLAKWKTAVQLVAVGFLIAGPAGDQIVPGVTLVGIVLLWCAAILTLYTGYDYFRAGAGHLIEEDEP
ncbi:CDP-diacylglycerol--glycerol-3-phosphate 3-phosphatidyltransferase [Phreatobacter cathodiphilus]|uniref:CDP-diacylglycerol--glycerol-3-phosphate 3-phosphatidyltransferase n=1 Tax=Phreatobacter cathodiphilus TaxID=1868589 RepID=A0A2S0NG24_9HYPH|nr:CDP-diacylglycerol--glycerol-3-phosphate 3-phosphatidyltransferase [Phreatobacter cathodiphilus]AVO46853.1 CDP-diacylglycerol--glycerol-3-phosphate 3-phosphatidyltransferase [Phreatobacter cathodiphilus]